MKYHLHYLIFLIIFLIFVVDIKITIPLNSAIDKEKVDSISTKQIKNKQNDKFNSKNYWENRYKTGGNSGQAHILIWQNSRPKLSMSLCVKTLWIWWLSGARETGISFL